MKRFSQSSLTNSTRCPDAHSPERKRYCLKMNASLFKNITAITYTYVVYSIGFSLILMQPWQSNFCGVVLLTHALVLSAAFTHEFIHGNIFSTKKTNVFWGRAMTYLNGGCYATWKALVEHHLNHHIHHADFVKFDASSYFNEMSPWRRWIYAALEWLYFPIFEFELRWRIILAPFWELEKQSQRWRSLALILGRTIAFILLAYISWRALLLYFTAYISFVNVMRFADAFHHTYDYVIAGQSFPQRDRFYEQAHTFSNLISTRHSWLNLLILNFGYHNAHHHNMSVPWHELPQLHQKLYASGGRLLPLPQLLANYHRLRIFRLFSEQGEFSLESKENTAYFTGGVAVSLFTPP